MPDLETRIDEGLAGTAERAPHPTDLAAGARARLRRRRRTSAGVVAAAVAVAAVPVGLVIVGGDARGPERDTNDASSASQAPAGWRTETWHDLSVSVPPGWGWSGGTDWCSGGKHLGDVGPTVSRPVVVRTVDCSPSFGPGVHFGEPTRGELPPGTEGTVQQYQGDTYPDGSWIGYASTQDAAVWVVAADRTLARQVLDTVTPVGEVDANGCATRSETITPFTSDLLSVCRYESRGWLEQSELLSSADSEAARDAVAAAPGSACEQPATDAEVVTLRSAGFGYYVVLADGCATVTDDAGITRRATPEVLHWALSPGWSGTLSFLSYDTSPGALQLRHR